MIYKPQGEKEVTLGPARVREIGIFLEHYFLKGGNANEKGVKYEDEKS